MAWTKEARDKAIMVKKQRGKFNQYSYGAKMSDETKIKIGLTWKGRKHSEKSKKLMGEKARLSNHRRLQKSIREYTKLDGTIVQLDSSWEEILAKRLDQLKINWIRPDPIKWIDSKQKLRNYFPDFYLPDFNLYLDPKNPAAAKQQKEKIDWLNENIKNVIFLYSLEEIYNFMPPSFNG